jgi:tetratricopeptide (TPR) repeat protein
LETSFFVIKVEMMRGIAKLQSGLRRLFTVNYRLLFYWSFFTLPIVLTGQNLYWQPKSIVKFWDRYINPLEFRTPLKFMPFDVKGGMVPFGGPDMFRTFPFSMFREDHSVVVLDSTESEMSTIRSLANRIALVVEVDLLKINPSQWLVPGSLVDIMVGVGLRTNQMLYSPALPDNWPQATYEYKFAPVFHQAMLHAAFIHQRSEKWFAYFQAARGAAIGSVYRFSSVERYLSGDGSSRDYVLGLKFFRPGGGGARYTLGAELRYHRLEVPELDDSDNLSPIEGLQMRYLGAFLTFGVAFGGRSTPADRAKRDLYTGDYISAESNLQAFLLEYPRHSKVRRARKLLSIAEKWVPYQQVDLARTAQQQGRLEEALQWLDEAETRADTTLMPTIDRVRAEVGYVYLQYADSMLRRGELENTNRMLGHARLLMPPQEDLVDQYDAEVLIRQGHILRTEGAFMAALKKYDLAIGADTSRRVEIEGFKVRVAEDLLQEAEAAADRSALALALESLKLSRALDPRRKVEVDDMITELERRLDRLIQGEIRQSMEDQLQEARELRQKVPSSKPRIGLLVAQIEDILGPPDFVAQGTDRFGINHQLWEYRGGEYPGLYYFENYILSRMEPLPER